MIEILDCEQGSPDWYQSRLGIPTASAFASIMAKGEGKMRRAYMMKLLGERFTGEPSENFSNGHMERGRAMEAEARAAYAFMQDADPVPVGFIRNGSVGCSPDSLIGETGLLEIKTKLPHIQLEVVLNGELPSEHRAQVHGQLWVAEREFVDFVSYWPRLPVFVKRIARDETYIATLKGEVERFNDELAHLADRLITSGARPWGDIVA